MSLGEIRKSNGVRIAHPGKDLDAVMTEVLSAYPDELFCFLNENKLRKNVGILSAYFLPTDERRKILYALKANPLDRIVQILNEEGIDGFDCASPQEIDLALGLNPKAEIYFNHPIKTRGAIRTALQRGVRYFAAQAKKEIEKILEPATPHDYPEIAIRLQTWNEKAKINLSTKFGASETDTGEMLKMLKDKAAPRGLCIHTGSQNESPEAFESGIELMASIAKSEGGVHSINVGGGIPVNIHPDDIKNFLTRISQSVRDNLRGVLAEDARSPKIILEPGRAIIAEAVDMAIPVLAVEKRWGKKCAYIHDGVFTSFSDYPIHHWKWHFQTFSTTGREFSAVKEPYVVFGRTCDSGDTLGEILLPDDLREGDFLRVPSAGAYMDSQASNFNGFGPPKYVSYNS